MSRKRVSRRNPFSVRYSTDLVLAQRHPSQFRLNCFQKGKSCLGRTLENLKKNRPALFQLSVISYRLTVGKTDNC